MNLNTKHFGQVEVEDRDIITFNAGLPGFETNRKFVLIGNDNDESPFKWLQCVDDSKLAFAVANPFKIKKDYLFDISDETVKELEIENAEDISTLSILVVPEDPSRISMNLKAPVIINSRNRKAAQIILDTDKYTVRHYILDELRRQEVADNVGTHKEERSDDRNK